MGFEFVAKIPVPILGGCCFCNANNRVCLTFIPLSLANIPYSLPTKDLRIDGFEPSAIVFES